MKNKKQLTKNTKICTWKELIKYKNTKKCTWKELIGKGQGEKKNILGNLTTNQKQSGQ